MEGLLLLLLLPYLLHRADQGLLESLLLELLLLLLRRGGRGLLEGLLLRRARRGRLECSCCSCCCSSRASPGEAFRRPGVKGAGAGFKDLW